MADPDLGLMGEGRFFVACPTGQPKIGGGGGGGPPSPSPISATVSASWVR